ncbi:hypothetical protein JCM13267_00180 [Howardella ureilytica]
MRTVYPVFIKNIDNKYYSIYLPDFDTHTSTEYLDLWKENDCKKYETLKEKIKALAKK